jgi:hypothetical protein
MLIIFDGRPGDGKSYTAVGMKILPHLAAGGYVATNIEMNLDGVSAYILKRTGKIFDSSRLRILTEDEAPSFHRHIPPGNENCQVLVVLDEAHLFFNSRDWAKSDKDHRATFNLATQHRKYFLDIVLISQHFANIDSQFLRLVEELWRFRDLGKWRFPFPGMGWLRVPFVRFLAIVFDRNGKTVMRRYWQSFDKLVGGAYNTRAVSRGSQMSGSVERVQLDSDPVHSARLAKVRRIAGISMLVIIVGVCGFLAYYYGRSKGDPDKKELERLHAANERLSELLKQKPEAARMPEPPPSQAGFPLPMPEKRKTWFDTEPITEVVVFGSSLEMREGISILAFVDGATQRFFQGGWVSRGRVMSIVKLNHKLFDVEISDDNNKRHRLRFLRQDVPAQGGGAVPSPASTQTVGGFGGLPAAPGASLNSPLQTATFGGYAVKP